MSNGRKANEKTPECVTFQDELPSLFELGVDMGAQPHLETCANCSALVRDLQYIADQAALLLPIHDPSSKVWENIQSEIRKETSGVK